MARVYTNIRRGIGDSPIRYGWATPFLFCRASTPNNSLKRRRCSLCFRRAWCVAYVTLAHGGPRSKGPWNSDSKGEGVPSAYPPALFLKGGGGEPPPRRGAATALPCRTTNACCNHDAQRCGAAQPMRNDSCRCAADATVCHIAAIRALWYNTNRSKQETNQ